MTDAEIGRAVLKCLPSSALWVDAEATARFFRTQPGTAAERFLADFISDNAAELVEAKLRYEKGESNDAD